MSTERLNIKLMFVIIALYAAVMALNLIWDPSHPGWIDMKIHPFGIVVLIASLRGGRFTGLMAGIVGASILLGLRFSLEGLPRYLEDIIDWKILDLPLVLIVMGYALGDVRVQLQAQIDALNQDVVNLKGNREDLKNQVASLEDANASLRERAFGQLSPEGFLYRTSRRLETVDEGDVFEGAMDLLKGHMKISKGVFYRFEGDALVAKSWRGWEEPPAANLSKSRVDIINRVLEHGVTASLREALVWNADIQREPTDIVLAIPVKGRTPASQGVITIEEIPFLQLTENNEQSIRMVGDWAAMSLDRCHDHARLKSQAIYDEELGIFSEEHFHSTLAREFVTARRLKQTFLVFESSIAGFHERPPEQRILVWKAVGQVLQRTLRGTDIVARHGEAGCLWILCTGPNLDASFMMGRLNKHLDEHLHEGGISLEHFWIMGPAEHASAKSILDEFGSRRA